MFYIIIFLIVTFVVYAIYSSMPFAEAIKRLGLREPKKYDGYEKRGAEQFREECSKYSIRIDCDNTPNLCYLIPALNMKGLHLEFIKDGHEEYNNKEGNYLGSEEWTEKWRRIIFAPTITSSDFCQCIKIIMQAHNFHELDNRILPIAKGLNGRIKEKDSFFMYRALYIMHYNIRIRRNDLRLEEYVIFDAISLKVRNEKGRFFIYPEDNISRVRKLSEIIEIHEGIDIHEGKITLEKSYTGLVYLNDIAAGKSSVFYDNCYCISYKSYISFGFIVMGKVLPFPINKWKEEENILTENVLGFELNDESVICDYLLLYLRLVIDEIKSDRKQKTRLELAEIQNLRVAIPPRNIQKEIIRESRSAECDNEQMKMILDSFDELLTRTISDNISLMPPLIGMLSDEIELNSLSDSSSLFNSGSYYSGFRTEWVQGHYRKDGVYVQGHYRSRRK